jgi:glycosyltransferase involved in cell wall biosynthesis
MARAVVVSASCAGSIDARAGVELEVAASADGFAAKVLGLLASDRRDALGRAARARVLAQYDWSTNLEHLGALLARPAPDGVPHSRPARAAVAGAA